MTIPADVWRVCGQPVVGGPGSGCTCGLNDPTRWQARRALDRLASERRGGAVQLPNRERGSTSKAGG